MISSSMLLSGDVGFVSVNQYRGNTGHIDVTFWDVHGSYLGTYGKNVDSLFHGGWHNENDSYFDTGRRVNTGDTKLAVSPENATLVKDYINREVAGGPGTEVYQLVRENCVDGVEQVLFIAGVPYYLADLPDPTNLAVYRLAQLHKSDYRLDAVQSSKASASR